MNKKISVSYLLATMLLQLLPHSSRGAAAGEGPANRLSMRGAITATDPRLALRHSGKGCASLATSRGRTSSSSIDMRKGRPIVSPALRPSWCVLKSTLSWLPGSSTGARRKKRPIRFRLSWRGFRRSRRRSGFVASLARPGGNITGLSTLSPEIKWKTTGASEGDSSQSLARGRPWEFDQPGNAPQRERDSTRRKALG